MEIINPPGTGTASSGLTLVASVATTSGTSHDFTGIPAGVKRITVMLTGVSTNGSSALLIQLGDSGGVEATGYAGSAQAGTAGSVGTTGFLLTQTNSAAWVWHGGMSIELQDTLKWSARAITAAEDGRAHLGAGSKTLSDTLDRVRLTTVNGTDTFDAGSWSINYE